MEVRHGILARVRVLRERHDIGIAVSGKLLQIHLAEEAAIDNEQDVPELRDIEQVVHIHLVQAPSLVYPIAVHILRKNSIDIRISCIHLVTEPRKLSTLGNLVIFYTVNRCFGRFN